LGGKNDYAVYKLGEEEKTSMSFDDPRVCKSFLLGCCPHDILASTVSEKFVVFKISF